MLLSVGASAQTAPGFTYTIRVTGSSPTSAPGITGGAGAQSYVGRATAIDSRGRLDVTDGGIDGLFEKGDYILFDATDMVVVHPAQRRFMSITREASMAAMAHMDSLGMTIRLSDEKVTLDSVGLGDTISGNPTVRYRLTMAFNMSMDLGQIQQRLGTQTVTDYWVARVPGLPPNPLLRSNGISGPNMTGMFKALSMRVDSVSRRMGNTIALRAISTTNINTGPGQVMETRQSAEVSDIRPAGVDVSLLVLPAAYKAEPFPGTPEAKTGDGAKWKAPPRK